MPVELTSESLAAWFNDHAAKYKSAYGEIQPLADGYLPTETLGELLGQAVGTIQNPTVPKAVPKPITIATLMAAVPLTLIGIPTELLEPVAARVREEDRQGILMWAHVLYAREKMTSEELQAVQALVVETVDDPSWSAELPGPSDLQTQFGLSWISHHQINEALGRV